MPNFTTDDLLLYLYGESEPQQVKMLETALQKDWALQQKLQVLQESMNQLDELSLSTPRPQTLEVIKQYAELSHVTH